MDSMEEIVESFSNRNNYRMRLISLIKANPMLWDKSSEDFNNRTLRSEKWMEVALALGVSTAKLRRTWENLRDQYRRDLKRYLGHGIKSKWRFFNNMNFIRSMVRIQEDNGQNSDSGSEQGNTHEVHLKRKLSKGNPMDLLETINEQENISVEEKLLNDLIQHQIVDDHQRHKPKQIEATKTIYCETAKAVDLNCTVKVEMESRSNASTPEPMIIPQISAPAEETAITPILSEPHISTSVPSVQSRNVPCSESSAKRFCFCTTTSSEDLSHPDEDFHFVMSILPSLRRINTNRKLFLRMGILNLLAQELEQEHY